MADGMTVADLRRALAMLDDDDPVYLDGLPLEQATVWGRRLHLSTRPDREP